MAITDYFGGIDLQSATNTVTILIFTFIVLILIGVGTFFLVMSLKYNKKIVFFENLAGTGFQPTSKDKAILLRLGDGGERILHTRRKKLYLPAYGTPASKNTYWFFLGPDGYYRNFILGEIDLKNHANIITTDKDMRYANVAIRRNIESRYNQQNFWEKYGGVIAYGALIILTAVGMWLLFDKWLEVSSSLVEAVNAAKEVLKTAQQVLGAADTLQSGGSGIR